MTGPDPSGTDTLCQSVTVEKSQYTCKRSTEINVNSIDAWHQMWHNGVQSFKTLCSTCTNALIKVRLVTGNSLVKYQ